MKTHMFDITFHIHSKEARFGSRFIL